MRHLAAALALLFAGAAGEAGACQRGQAGPEAVAAVPATVWRETAKFSFLIGRDYDAAEVKMELMTRLKTFSAFAELRAAAGGWGSDYLKMLSLTQNIAQEAPLADRLTQLCFRLDRAALLGEPLDEQAWTAELRDVAAHMDQLIASGPSFRATLARYADLLDAAAGYYARAAHGAIVEADIGPDPVAVAGQVRNVQGRWHAIFADLEFARASLPAGPDGRSEAAIKGLAVAAAALRSIKAQAAAIAADYIPFEAFRTFAGGDYLHEACVAAENRYVLLGNLFRSDGVLLLRGEAILVASPPPADEKPARWLFLKDDNGYWTIANGTSGSKLLDFTNAPGAAFPLRLTGGLAQGRAARMSQRWRCYPSRFSGHARLTNATLGEGRSLDTYSDDPKAVQLPTGNFSGQHWRIAP